MNKRSLAQRLSLFISTAIILVFLVIGLSFLELDPPIITTHSGWWTADDSVAGMVWRTFIYTLLAVIWYRLRKVQRLNDEQKERLLAIELSIVVMILLLEVLAQQSRHSGARP